MYLGQQGQNNKKKENSSSLQSITAFSKHQKKKTCISQIKVPTHFLDDNFDKGYSITPQYLDFHSKITDNHMDFLFSKVQNSIPSRA